MLLGLVTLGAIVLFLWSQRGDLGRLVEIRGLEVFVVAALFAFGHWLNSLEMWWLYRRLGAELGATENWLLFTAGQLLNHLPGRVGTLYRFEYLRKRQALAYVGSASVYATNLVITALASSTLGALGVLLTLPSVKGEPLPLLAVFGVVLAAAIVALVVPLPTARGEGVVARTWATFRSGWCEITSAPKTALGVGALDGLRYVVAAWRMQIAFSWVGVDGSWSFFLVLSAVTGVASFLAITPAALGVRELAIGAAATALGTPFERSLLGATLERSVLVLVSAITGGAGILFTSRQLGALVSDERRDPAAAPARHPPPET